ncbi:SET domain-containing protein [Ascobolus immersus RN42]|uniref:SET domain-containing protein n=1 Tax=Ascobolus immersus RN42 TaxID=1160509 RepID=A0A3N4IR46_ASCIM|nr:SET domain-containing protein [Ascobolus immersus RN42]
MGRAKKSSGSRKPKHHNKPKPSVAAASTSLDSDSPEPQIPSLLNENADIPSTETTPLFSVSHLPQKGLALVATSPIPAGTRILSEEPVLTLPPKYTALLAAGTYKPVLKALTEQYNDLAPEQREQVLLLSNPLANDFPHSLLGTFVSNARELDEVSGMGLALNVARVNHSCVPNAVTHWNRETECLNLHAVRDIEVGEEVTLGYIMLVKSGVERRRELRERWRFDCKCEACMLAPENQEDEEMEVDGEKEEGEKKVTEADRDKLISSLLALHPHIQHRDTLPYKVSLRCREKALKLFQQLHIAGQEITTCLFGAAMKATEAKDEARKGFFLQMVYENILMTEGLDSLETVLSAPGLPGYMEVQDLGKESIEEGKFEDWLWGDDRVAVASA